MVNIRWQQRFENFKSALLQLEEAVGLSTIRPLSELEKQGFMQVFEFTHELAWNVLKDYLAYQGQVNIMGSRDAAREAFAKGLILNGEAWMEMIQSRNKTTHTYNKNVSEEITKKIVSLYCPEFVSLRATMEQLKLRQS